jgi:hypothetical protein
LCLLYRRFNKIKRRPVERVTKMSKGRDRIVFRNEDGMWANKRFDADKASGLHKTQGEAIKEAKEMLHNQGGGELSVQGIHGRIVSKDTIPPGNDPCPPRDREH